MKPADPMLDVTTAVVLDGALSLISLRIENIYSSQPPGRHVCKDYTYVLVACIRKNYYWEARKSRHRASPFKNSDCPPLAQSVSASKVVDDKDDQVSDGDQGDDTRIFE